jgi:UDP:flavonoid glycosyltransferase YjiC (YdhE family)
LARQKLSAEQLAAGITQAVETPSISAKAARLGQQLRAEQGITEAVKALSRELQSTGRRTT